MTAKHDDFDPAWEDGSDVDGDDEDNVHENANDNHDVLCESLVCLLYTSPSPRDQRGSRMPSSA